MTKPAGLRLPVLLDGPGAPTFNEVATCVHCGFCLEACPTYRELRVETDSPRGRIYLMRGLLTEQIAVTPQVLKHLDQCLDCRACETACPSGVPYAQILEKTRTLLQPLRPLSFLGRALRWLVFSWLLPSRRAQTLVFRLLRWQQVLGITHLGRWLGRRGWLPGRLSAAAAAAPPVGPRSFRQSIGAAWRPEANAFVFDARGPVKKRVALFTGCLADHLFADVNQATVEVLTRNGCEVHVVGNEQCCGALHIHNGARDEAVPLARANVQAFAGPYDAIVSNAAGCSAELRHYGGFLADTCAGDEALLSAARGFESRVRDISEILLEVGFLPPGLSRHADAPRVAYDEPCHLLHAQKVSAAPKQVLAAIPGIERVPLEDADSCCGSAGVYSILQPHLAAPISARKVEAIRKSGADIVVTGNPGCLMQLRVGVQAAGLDVEVIHPVELLARAYRQADEA